MAVGGHVMSILVRAALTIVMLQYMASADAQRSIWAPNGETEFIGTAFDTATGKPVPRAWVLATYVLGSGGVHEQAHCTVAEVVQADERGEYRLPFYDGLPPQYINAFGRRYQWAIWLRNVTKDESLRWVVVTSREVDGKREAVAKEGPFASQEEALKASHKLRDVWLSRFTGTDEEWLQLLPRMPSNASPGCSARKTRGVIGWHEALLAEAEGMPDSPTRQQTVKELRDRLNMVLQLRAMRSSPRESGGAK
jgi:hypothetical protein